MRLPLFALAALLALTLGCPVRAQGFDEPSKGGANRPSENSTAKLRGISYFFIDVLTIDPRPEDGDLRQELRDAIELEMRRAGLVPKEYSGSNPEAATPLLTIEIRFEKGSLGRFGADVTLSIRDNATIVRNREAVLAQTYVQTKKAVGSSDATLTKEIKARARELVTELLEGLKKAK